MSRTTVIASFLAFLALASGLVGLGLATPTAEAAPAEAGPASTSYRLTIPLGEGDDSILTVTAWSNEIVLVVGEAASGLPTGKRQHKPFVIIKELDKSTPLLMKACATGEHIKNVKLEARRTTKGRPEVYLTIELQDVVISSYQISGATADKPAASPTEQEHVAFTYQKIIWTFHDTRTVFEDDLSDGE